METLKQTKQHFSKLGLMYFLGTLIILGIQTLVVGIATRQNPAIAENTNVSLLLASASMYLLGMPLMVLLIRTVPDTRPQKHKMTAKQLFIAFLISYAFMYISNLFGTALTFVIGLLKGSPVNNMLAAVVLDLNPLISLLVIVIIAPIAEELIFRKLLVDRLCRYGEGIAVLFSGFMFGLFHGNLNQFAYAFFLGAFFAFIYVKTGRIIYTILLHACINFLGSFVSVQILQHSGIQEILSSGADPLKLQTAMAANPSVIIYYLYLIILFCAVAAGIVFFCMHFQKFTFRPGEIVIPKGKRFQITFLNAGMLLFAAFWIVQIIRQLLA